MGRRRNRGLDFGRSYRRKKIDKKRVLGPLSWVLQIVVVAAIAVVLVYLFCFRITMSGTSMQSTIAQGDKVLVNRFAYQMGTPDAGDVIVFTKNADDRDSYSIKRVVAEAGDTVQIVDGRLLVNGAEYDEEMDDIENAGIAAEEITLDSDEYFVLGDNPDSSEDSRFSSVGMITDDEIVGRAWFIISPRDSMGRVK